MGRRLLELDALRGIAACGVMIFHYIWRFDELYKHTFPPFGIAYYGQFFVHLFFMISGFVIYWSLERTRELSEFAYTRFTRLYPTYWVCIATTFTVVSVFGLPGRELQPLHAALNALMFHEFLRVPNVDGVYWSLRIELTFYVLIALFWRTTGGRYLIPALLGWIFLSLAIVQLLRYSNANAILALKEILIVKYSYLFSVGIVCYRMYARRAGAADYGVLAAAFAANFIIYRIDEALFIALCIALMILASLRPIEFLHNPLLLWLGAISYPLYLIHQNVGYVVLRESYDLGPAVAISLAIAAAIAVSWALHRFVELPGMRWLRSLTSQRQTLNATDGESSERHPKSPN